MSRDTFAVNGARRGAYSLFLFLFCEKELLNAQDDDKYTPLNSACTCFVCIFVRVLCVCVCVKIEDMNVMKGAWGVVPLAKLGLLAIRN